MDDRRGTLVEPVVPQVLHSLELQVQVLAIVGPDGLIEAGDAASSNSFPEDQLLQRWKNEISIQFMRCVTGELDIGKLKFLQLDGARKKS